MQKYNTLTGEYEHYTQNKLPGSLTHSSVFSLCRDNQGTIWVGTYYGGVNYFNPEADIFTHYTDNPHYDFCLSYPFIGNMVEDKNNNLWICTEGGGLNKLNRKTGKIEHFLADPHKNSIAHNNLKSICYDSKRNVLYIGTHTGGLSKYDISSNHFTNYLENTMDVNQKPNDVIHKVDIYGDKLIILARNGLFQMDLITEKFSRLFPDIFPNIAAGVDFIIDSKGYIWLSRVSYINRIKIDDPSDVRVYNTGEMGLGVRPIKGMFETLEGDIYIGTQGSGLFRFNPATQEFVEYSVENGNIPSNYCYKITQSQQGNLIVTSSQNIFIFNPEKGLIETINLGPRGLLINAIYESCGLYVCQNGEIYVGGADGLSSFYEEDLSKKNKPYNIYFSELYIANKPIYPLPEKGVLTDILAYTKSIILNHKQNNLIFYFASNNYVGMLSRSTFEYILEGFDNEWIETYNNSIYYTNLNPGKYVLKVKEKKPASLIQSPEEIQLVITIKRPFYSTPLAYFLYFLMTALIISTFIYFRYSKMKLAASLDAEKKEKERIEELNQSKLRFFTNISHEFRTPLTLIISQIELLLQNTSLSPLLYNKILKVYKHTYHMRNLISELLDFRKFEQKHVTLNVSEQNLIPFLQEIYLSFYEYSLSNEINYKFTPRKETILCWFDPNQMKKVFYNILSNAFKYTKRKGVIELNIQEEENKICINIIDNGIGIDKKNLNQIFGRFYQVDDDPDKVNKGTGIGLALTKSIVESHYGTISVESQLGYGSIFSVRLRKGNEHFNNDPHIQILSDTPKDSIQPDTLPDPLLMENMIEVDNNLTSVSSEEDKPLILIVEDNEELLQILTTLFSPIYKVIQARNGEEGLRKTMEDMPHLVLSDIMMPIMSGTEMCLRIKSNLDICHIPVVLLTALNSNEQNMEGLQKGADDYIGKPFNAKLLFARCNNLIRNRRLLQKKYHSQTDVDNSLLVTNQLDQNFMERIEEVIKRNLDNPEFDINQLAKEIGLGRSTLFSKFKGLTGMTPNDFIVNYKLKMASTLLRTRPDLQIAEISDLLGFSSPRYFGKCFKEQYLMSPLEYRKNKSE